MRAPTTDTPRYSTRLKYTDRASKAPYIADKYASILSGRVLDVGCDEKQLGAHLPEGVEYVGVDLNPAADVIVNLDREDLPFDDDSFDVVICCDVLEHLERLHAVFDKLCAVARSRVIIALPNPARCFLLEVAEGREGPLKYYGLPVDEPADRHRWFFGYEECVHFLRERSRRNGWSVEHLDTDERGQYAWERDGVDVTDSPNLREGTTWCVLKPGVE